MAQKKIGIVGSLVFFALSNVWSQSCPILAKYTKYRTRKYYVLDTGDSAFILSIPEAIQQIRSRDTSLVKELIREGTIDHDIQHKGHVAIILIASLFAGFWVFARAFPCRLISAAISSELMTGIFLELPGWSKIDCQCQSFNLYFDVDN